MTAAIRELLRELDTTGNEAVTTFAPVPIAEEVARVSKLLPHQAKLLASTESEVLVTGGRGAGMSYAVHAWLNQAVGRALLVVPSGRESYDLPGQGKFDFLAIRELSEKLLGLNSRHAELPRYERIAFDVSADRLPMSIYMASLAKWGRTNGVGKLRNCRFVIASVPPAQGMKHWIAKRFLVKPNASRRVIRATLRDNPYLNNPGYYGKVLNALHEPMRTVWLEGSWLA